MKNICLTILFSFFGGILFAQSPILTKVKIEFERKVNTWATLQNSRFGQEMKNSIPQYSSSFYNYETDGDKAIYKLIPKVDNNNNRGGFFRSSESESNVYTDFKAKEQIALKSVFEKTYLVTDSFRPIEWKITNDFRDIAGFSCRRATAVIMDSVFVVAFYTDEILPSGGPEGFTGLPGMILGLVINRLHTTWYATKVNVTDVNTKEIVPPSANKAEKTNRVKLIETLKERFKSGGFFGGNDDSIIWNIMI